MSHDFRAGAVLALAAQDRPSFPVEQEFSLEVPLGYAPSPPATPPRIAVILHVFHADLLPEIAAYLGNIGFAADLFVSTTDEAKRAAVARCFAGWPQGTVEVRITPNRGRDIAPKLVGFAEVHGRYEYVLHLHTKVSAHDPALEGWRGYLLETLLGSPETVRGVFEAFSRHPGLGMLAPQHVEKVRSWIGWGGNFPAASELARRMDLALTPEAPLDFPSGSMFWARSAALRPLLDLGLRFEDFPEEAGQTDTTLAHGIERLYFLVCERAGFDWTKIAARGLLHDQHAVVAVRGPAALNRFLSAHRVRLTDPLHERRCTEARIAAAVSSGRPKRPMHVLWRRALGHGLPPPSDRQIAVALLGEEGKAAWAKTAASARLALGRLPSAATGRLLAPDGLMPGTVGGDAARRNWALRAGFDGGADAVLLVTAPGILHPASIEAMLRMAQAAGGDCLLEASRFPQAHAKPVGAVDFSIGWAAGPCIAVPRAVFGALGGFDERLAGHFAEMDLSWRARAFGFQVRQCPAALFLCGAGAAAAEADPAILAAGLMLARKWGNAAVEAEFAALLRATGQVPPGQRIDPVPADWRGLAHFADEPAPELFGWGPACPQAGVMEPAGLDIVVRFYETTDLPRLERCVFSLVGQGCGPRRVHLMLQRFSISQVQAVRSALQPLLDLDEDLGLTLHNWLASEPDDLQVPLLNFAVQVTRARYLTFIDAGDVVLPGAFAALLARLRVTAAVAAVGGMATQRVSWWGDVVQPHSAATSPPADPFGHTDDGAASPLLFVLDRTRLQMQRLTFEAGRPGAELVGFLHRLSTDGGVDVAAAAKTLGLRQVPPA